MTFLQISGGMFSQSLIGLWYGFVSFIPAFLGALILFIIGWILGGLVGKAVRQVVNALKIDKFFESAGANAFMQKVGLRLNIAKFFDELVKWFIIVVFLMASLQIIGLTQVNDFLREAVLYYLPKVIVASLVLILLLMQWTS